MLLRTALTDSVHCLSSPWRKSFQGTAFSAASLLLHGLLPDMRYPGVQWRIAAKRKVANRFGDSSGGWLHSFQAGRSGIPGTEIVQLVSHKGSLFASVGYWMHPSHHPGRILRLDCPTCEWEMEHPEEGNVYMSYVVRLECLR